MNFGPWRISAKLDLDNPGSVATRRIKIAEMINVCWLALALDRHCRGMKKGDRRVTLGDHQGDVVDLRLLEQHAGEGVFLDPDLEIDRHRGPQIAAIPHAGQQPDDRA